MKLKAKFQAKKMEADILRWVEKDKIKFRNALTYIGEEFVNKARNTKTYIDDTGLLRSTIGYAILNNGKPIFYKHQSPEGGELISELKEQYNKGYVLILFAGAEYALYVEAMGYDVISGSAPNQNKVYNDLKELIGDD